MDSVGLTYDPQRIRQLKQLVTDGHSKSCSDISDLIGPSNQFIMSFGYYPNAECCHHTFFVKIYISLGDELVTKDILEKSVSVQIPSDKTSSFAHLYSNGAFYNRCKISELYLVLETLTSEIMFSCQCHNNCVTQLHINMNQISNFKLCEINVYSK